MALGSLTGVPTSFTPAAHDQPWSTITGTPTSLAGYGIQDTISNFDGAYGSLTGTPTAFTPAAHDQAWSTITDTPTSLAGYGIQDTISTFDGAYGSLTGTPTAFTPAAHDQAWSTITGTPTSLAGYGIQDTISTFDGAYGNLTGVPTSFTPATHNQAWSTITGTPTSLAGYGILDAFSAAPVRSVSGKTGAVQLNSQDVGLGSVNNTSDFSKPVSQATQLALNSKVGAYTESQEVTYVNNTTISIAHQLGSVPKDWHIVIRCKTAEHGYQPGDEILPFIGGKNPQVTIFGCYPFVTDQNVGLITTQSIPILSIPARTFFNITLDSWRIVARWRS